MPADVDLVVRRIVERNCDQAVITRNVRWMIKCEAVRVGFAYVPCGIVAEVEDQKLFFICMELEMERQAA